MRTESQTLAAGQVWPIGIAGFWFRVIDAPNPVDVVFYSRGRPVMQASQVAGGMWAKPDGGFDRIDIVNGGTGQTVKVAISAGDAGYDMATLAVSGEVEIKNDVGNPIPMVATGTTTIADVDAPTLGEVGPVAVGVAATLLVAAAAGRRAVRFTNYGTDTVFLGSAGITTANGAVSIAPGQTFHEDRAGAAAWYGISNTAAQSVRIQTIA